MKASLLRISRSQYMELRKNNKDFFDAYSLHKTIYNLFPKKDGQTRDFLYRFIDSDVSEKRILIFSEDAPLECDFGTLEVRDVPESFLEMEYYGFDVQINPVKRSKDSGKIVPEKGRDELSAWFTAKAPSFGFEVLPGSLSVGDTNIVQFKKDEKKVTLAKAIFTGRLKVTDRELFKKSVKDGIGKGKAFGFGLLQVMPLKNIPE